VNFLFCAMSVPYDDDGYDTSSTSREPKRSGRKFASGGTSSESSSLIVQKVVVNASPV
jgi:hypothetical protein